MFNGNFSLYFNNNTLFRKFKMGYGAFYVICPRAFSQYVTPVRGLSAIAEFPVKVTVGANDFNGTVACAFRSSQCNRHAVHCEKLTVVV